MQHLGVNFELFGGLNFFLYLGFLFFAQEITADFYRAAWNADAVLR